MGADDFYSDLVALGFKCRQVLGSDQQNYVVIDDYEIELGKFKGEKIQLGLLAPSDYPRRVGASIHVRSSPILYDKQDTLPGVRNILDSPLGEDWRYWSYGFRAEPVDTARNLMEQINGVFKRA